jgi:P27 family predicted phage terminase small subunit
MGKRGPKPTPTAVLAARGSWRAALRQGEPQPKVCVPPCPDWLSGDSQKMFNDLAALLAGLGMMTECDTMSLASLCDAWHDFLNAREIVEREGITTMTQNGNEITHPAVSVKNKAWMRVMKGCHEFGLTPSARSGIVVGAPSKGEQATEEENGLLKVG